MNLMGSGGQSADRYAGLTSQLRVRVGSSYLDVVRNIRRHQVQTPSTDLTLRTGATAIKPDHYVKSRKWIVEAKKSEARPYVRLAIGQVLDYVALAKTHNIEATPVILLPRRPIPDLVALLRTHGILLATPKGIDVVDFVVE